MGSCSYSITGDGMTEQEARRDALNRDRDKHGHEEGYNGGISSSRHEDDRVKCLVKPVPAKRCIVTKDKHTGAKVWKTVFVITPSWSTENFRDHREHDGTQAEAIKIAKEMALEFNKEFTVTVAKKLVKGDINVAVVTPKKSVIGRWLFTGTARC